MKKQRSTTKIDDRSSEDVAESVFVQSLQAIDDEIRGLRDGSIKPSKRFDKASRIAWLAKQAASFAAELRKAKAAAEKKRDHITRALVIDWARTLPPTERGQVVREIQAIDTRGSGLA